MVVRIIEHVFRSYQYVLHPTARQGRALEHLLAADCNAARNVLWLGSSLRREKREAETGAA